MTRHPAITVPESEEDFDQLLADEYESLETGYESPLVARLREKRLTVEMLAKEIPRIRAGEEADRLLGIPSGNRSEERTIELMRIRTEGVRAKERILATALPLIRTVAHKEWKRRQQWGSQVVLEDLLQEATLGFLKGLAAFKQTAVRRSATNYLGQWMTVEMRRSAETMDNDMQVGHDAGERFRKIRALRSRLVNDLGREPTDDEIAAASHDSNYVTRPNMMGRAPTEENPHPPQMKGITGTQIMEERNTRLRVGHVSRFSPVGEESETGGVDPERITAQYDAGSTIDPADVIADSAQRAAIALLVSSVMARIRMPSEQADIVGRRFGLPPHEKDSSAREISRVTGIHRERVTRILNAFTSEMTRKGGYFHEAISLLSEDDAQAAGLMWIVDRLGPWNPALNAQNKLPRLLTEARKRQSPVPSDGHTESQGVIAWFQCDYHDRLFSGVYPNRNNIPKTRACPLCNGVSHLMRIQSQK